MTTAVVQAPAKAPKHIEVNGHRIHFRLGQQVVYGVILGLLSVAAMAAFYYLVFQTNHHVKDWWDNLFPQSEWTTYRHGLRNVGEGILAKFAVETFIAKWQKHPDVRLSGVQMSLRIPLLLVESLALIVVGVWAVSYGGPTVWHHFLHHHHVSAVHIGGPFSTIFAGFNWPDFIVGFVAAHVLRPQWRPIGNTVNLGFIEKAVDDIRARRARTGNLDWLPAWVKLPVLPPTVRERISWMLDSNVACRPHGAAPGRLAIGVAVAFVGLAGYGEYVLHVIAKRH